MNENKIINLFLDIRHNRPGAYQVFRGLVREILVEYLIEIGLVEYATPETAGVTNPTEKGDTKCQSQSTVKS